MVKGRRKTHLWTCSQTSEPHSRLLQPSIKKYRCVFWADSRGPFFVLKTSAFCRCLRTGDPPAKSSFFTSSLTQKVARVIVQKLCFLVNYVLNVSKAQLCGKFLHERNYKSDLKSRLQ